MPIKKEQVKEVVSKAKTKQELVPVFDLEKLNPASLPELATFKEKQLQIVKDNPFVEITDTASRDLAKKHRTNRVSARTALQAQDKLISAKFNEAKTKAKTYIAELIAYTQPGEIEQQKEIDRDEAVLEAKRQEKARIEQARIDNIRSIISNYGTEWETAFNLMIFDTIDEVSATFLDSYIEYDTTPLEEFEVLFTKKVEELTQVLEGKTSLLKAQEETRLEKEAMRLAAEKLAKEKADFDAKQKAIEEENKKKQDAIDAENKKKADAIAAEQKAIADANEKTRLANEATLKSIADAQAKLDADKKEAEQLAIRETVNPAITEDVRLQPLRPEECFSESQNMEAVKTSNIVTETTEATRIETIIESESWNTIFEAFKSSGEKSLSKWLEANYNVPTKK